MYTCVIFLLIDVVVVYSVLYSHGPQGQYYIDYTYVILQYLLGFGYAVIYYSIERKNLQVFFSLLLLLLLTLFFSLKAIEGHFQELNLFERIFSGSMSFASFGENVHAGDDGSCLTMSKMSDVSQPNQPPQSIRSQEDIHTPLYRWQTIQLRGCSSDLRDVCVKMVS